MKIRAYLALLAAIVTIPVILVSAGALQMLDRAGQGAALRGMHETARASALVVDRELYASEIRLRVLAASHELANGDLPALHETMRKAERPTTDGWLLLVDETGHQVLNTRVQPGMPLPAVATRAQIDKLFELNQAWVSNLVEGPISRNLQVAVAIPVRFEDGRRYALVEVLTTGLFARLLNESGVPETWTHALIDRDGKFIARSRNPEHWVGKLARPELIEASRANDSGQIRHQTWEKVDTWDVFMHSRRGGWMVAVAAPVAVVEGAGRQATMVAAAGIASALLLAGIAAWLFGRRLVRSLDRAARASVMLGRGEVPPPTDSAILEMRELHRALERAAELISDEQASRQVAETERERLLEVEQQARLAAERESRSKDAFLAMLGHELRNPLSAISAGIMVIKASAPGSEAALRANEIIARQCTHLERIVDDLLDMARMLVGKVKLVTSPLSLAEAVQRSIDAMQAAGRFDRHELKVSAAPLVIDADPARIEQIISNLLNNAIKYTPAGGCIEVVVREDDGLALLEVSDNGIGMSPELLSSVFEIFVQGQTSLDRSQGGLGIGLTMVRKLVELHGGWVRAESAGEGAGSRFTVALPMYVVHGNQAATAVADGLIENASVDRTADGVADDALATPVETVAVAQRLPASAGTPLLLVEDNPDAREMTAELLKACGYRVTACPTGHEALEVAYAGEHDVAVIDIGLPDISGYEVARQLRQAQQTAAMGLIALTGYGLASDVRAAHEAGFDLHLVKPVNQKRLIEAIESSRQSRKPATPV